MAIINLRGPAELSESPCYCLDVLPVRWQIQVCTKLVLVSPQTCSLAYKAQQVACSSGLHRWGDWRAEEVRVPHGYQSSDSLKPVPLIQQVLKWSDMRDKARRHIPYTFTASHDYTWHRDIPSAQVFEDVTLQWKRTARCLVLSGTIRKPLLIRYYK